MIIRSSYLHDGISYIGKIALLYWIKALDNTMLFEINDDWWLLINNMPNFVTNLVSIDEHLQA